MKTLDTGQTGGPLYRRKWRGEWADGARPGSGEAIISMNKLR
jgi:hypothetical protein